MVKADLFCPGPRTDHLLAFLLFYLLILWNDILNDDVGILWQKSKEKRLNGFSDFVQLREEQLSVMVQLKYILLFINWLPIDRRSNLYILEATKYWLNLKRFLTVKMNENGPFKRMNAQNKQSCILRFVLTCPANKGFFCSICRFAKMQIIRGQIQEFGNYSILYVIIVWRKYLEFHFFNVQSFKLF